MGDAGPATLVMRVFTHPACGGCGNAVRAAWTLSEAHPEIALRTVSLDNAEGLAEAHAAGIRTIPTLILDDGKAEIARWVGAPSGDALEAAVREARQVAP